MEEQITPKELNEAIKSKLGNLALYQDQHQLSLKSISALKNFVNKEYSFWDKLFKNNRSSFFDLMNTYTDLKGTIDQLSKATTSKEIESYLNTIRNDLLSPRIASYRSEFGKFIYHEYKLDPNVAGRVYQHFRQNPKIQIDLKTEVSIKATLFNLKLSHSKIIESKTEKIEQDINQFQNDLDKLLSDYDSIKYASDSLLNEYQTSFFKLKEQIDKNIATYETDVRLRIQDWNNKIAELESLYNDKLSLEAPVNHWQSLEAEYTKNGKSWTAASVLVAVLIAIIAVLLLTNIQPNIKKEFSILDLKQFIIITLTFTGLSYLLSLFIKQALSSFHLAKDAKERLQLTKVYLAMLGNKSIQNEERLIVLQSLFSRADTGLIKGDGAPTMPTFGSSILDMLNKTKTGNN